MEVKQAKHYTGALAEKVHLFTISAGTIYTRLRYFLLAQLNSLSQI
jgi:hypothetical protein